MSARMFNGNNLPHELLLTTRQTTKLRNAIENNMATDIKLRKAQISKIIQSGGFLDKLLGPLLKTGLPLLKSVIKPPGLLGLAAASSATEAGFQKNKKILGSGRFSDSASQTTTLIISNMRKNDKMKIFQALENSSIRYFSSIFIRKFLTGKGTVRAGQGTVRAGEGILKKTLMLPHPLTNFEIREYYENEPRFNGVYSRDNLPERRATETIKNEAYVKILINIQT